jgi:hypothetical protein
VSRGFGRRGGSRNSSLRVILEVDPESKPVDEDGEAEEHAD